MEESEEKTNTFRLGDTVKILSGPFNGFRGNIEGINRALQLLNIKLLISGRDEPVRFHFSDVVKLLNN